MEKGLWGEAKQGGSERQRRAPQLYPKAVQPTQGPDRQSTPEAPRSPRNQPWDRGRRPHCSHGEAGVI